MRSTTKLIAAPILAGSLLLTGCGGSSKTADSAASQAAGAASSGASAVASGASDAASGASAAASSTVDVTPSATASEASSCPTEATQKFAKTRFLVNAGIATGVLKHWIIDPYRDGKFQQGADGRTAAMVKAGLAGAFAAKQIKDATVNVKSDPTLCKIFIKPMTALNGQIDNLTNKVKSGDVSGIAGTAATVDELLNAGKAAGIEIKPQENVPVPGA